MRQASWIGLVLAVLSALPAISQQTGLSRTELWRQDLDALESGLDARHPKMRANAFRARIAGLITDLRNRLDHLNDRQIAIGIAAILAAFQEVHTTTDLSFSAVPMPRVPFAFRWFSDGLFITTSVNDSSTRLLGYRVVRIGNTPAAEAHTALLPFISTENQHWAHDVSQAYLRLPDLLHAAGLIESTDTVPVTIASRTGEETNMEMKPALAFGSSLPGPLRTFRPEPLYQRSPAYRYWFDFLPQSRTLYFKYNQCLEMPTIPFDSFLGEMREARADWPVERLVIDLRDNGGGGWKYIDDFLRLHERDLRAGVASYPRGMYAIIGKHTASAAVTSAIMLKKAGFVLVGEPTGGKPATWGLVDTFTLPNSRMSVTSSTGYVDQPGYDGLTLEPDVFVPFPSSAWWAGRDAFLDEILKR